MAICRNCGCDWEADRNESFNCCPKCGTPSIVVPEEKCEVSEAAISLLKDEMVLNILTRPGWKGLAALRSKPWGRQSVVEQLAVEQVKVAFLIHVRTGELHANDHRRIVDDREFVGKRLMDTAGSMQYFQQLLQTSTRCEIQKLCDVFWHFREYTEFINALVDAIQTGVLSANDLGKAGGVLAEALDKEVGRTSASGAARQ